MKLTKEQAIILTGFTGITCNSFVDFHKELLEAILLVWDELK